MQQEAARIRAVVAAEVMQDIVLLEEQAGRASEPAGGMWFPPEFFEYFTLEQ